MKKGLLFSMVLFLSLVLAGSMAFSQSEATMKASMESTAQVTTAANAETMTVTGTVIDNMCASSTKDIAAFIKTHAKECTLKPQCVASGYSIYADGALQAFDDESNAKIEEFLKKPESKLDIVVTATKTDGTLSLVSIENRK